MPPCQAFSRVLWQPAGQGWGCGKRRPLSFASHRRSGSRKGCLMPMRPWRRPSAAAFQSTVCLQVLLPAGANANAPFSAICWPEGICLVIRLMSNSALSVLVGLQSSGRALACCAPPPIGRCFNMTLPLLSETLQAGLELRTAARNPCSQGAPAVIFGMGHSFFMSALAAIS